MAREPSDVQLAEIVLSNIEGYCFGKGDIVPSGGRFIDRGSPSTFFSDESGTYQVTVTRVSASTPMVKGEGDGVSTG